MAKLAKDTNTGLCVDDARKALSPALQAHLNEARQTLLGLVREAKEHAPQVLLLEGGLESERQSMALWWAILQHCTQRSPHQEPCGQCPSCLHVGMRIHADVLAYDGRISNTEDTENPGPVRALTKEHAQILKGKLGDTTRSGQKRVVIISGIDTSRSAAANALLKVLEEPSPTTLFVLLTAQREQILPTLVSRSWVYTLPWPKSHAIAAEMHPWERALATFLQTGTGWWPMTAGKGAVTPAVAAQVLLLCQKSLLISVNTAYESAQHMSPTNTDNTAHRGPLSNCFSNITAHQRIAITQCLDSAQEALRYNVNPARILDLVAVQIHTIYTQRM